MRRFRTGSAAWRTQFRCAVRAFGHLFPGKRFGGGALCIYLDGQPVVDVWTGWSDRRGTRPWTADTGAMVFSATKGMASTVIHRLADRGLVDYDAPVARYWPAFAAKGKGNVTVRDLMRHRAGLSQLNGVSGVDLMDHLLMEDRMAAAPMGWFKGKPSYHALTYGWLMSGLARAVTGRGMRECSAPSSPSRSASTASTWAGRRSTRRLSRQGSSDRKAGSRIPWSTSSPPTSRRCRSRVGWGRCTSPA